MTPPIKVIHVTMSAIFHVLKLYCNSFVIAFSVLNSIDKFLCNILYPTEEEKNLDGWNDMRMNKSRFLFCPYLSEQLTRHTNSPLTFPKAVANTSVPGQKSHSVVKAEHDRLAQAEQTEHIIHSIKTLKSFESTDIPQRGLTPLSLPFAPLSAFLIHQQGQAV